MTTYFPATAETFVVEVNSQASEGFIRTPVLGWAVDDGRPLPMTLDGKHTLVGGCAILHPAGWVEDGISQYAFESVEAWLDSNPSEARKNPAPVASKTKTPAQDLAEQADGPAYDIEWTSATFKNNSFWHYDDGEHEFVFQIDGETPLPKATKYCVKIKRNDFMTMKKNVDVLTVDDIMNADPLPVEEADDEAGDYEDDYGEDLI